MLTKVCISHEIQARTQAEFVPIMHRYFAHSRDVRVGWTRIAKSNPNDPHAERKQIGSIEESEKGKLDMI